MTAGAAWYDADRPTFVKSEVEQIVGSLSVAAVDTGFSIEPEQNDEWRASIGLLQDHLSAPDISLRASRVKLIQEALSSEALSAYRDVVLEYDFRRRGLRLDCVLLGAGIIAVIEFKRSAITAADRDQVTNYAINLLEFHEETRRACFEDQCIIVPILVVTSDRLKPKQQNSMAFHKAPWGAVVRTPLECDENTMAVALAHALGARRAASALPRDLWLSSRFSPSSSILDAAISLYGAHDVSSIAGHAAPTEMIEKCIGEVAAVIEGAKKRRENRIVFVSGAPGAGKTLVGLKLAFDKRFRDDAVFVTGNAPLVEVLSSALQSSYRRKTRGTAPALVTGYAKQDAAQVVRMATFKIVKAHHFLGERGSHTGSADGSVVVFDEAQRTYAKGRQVLRKPLEEDEAELILQSLERSYPTQGAVVVALLGHNQAINSGELGAVAWFTAALKRGWRFSISDETLNLAEVTNSGSWAQSPNRDRLVTGHLPHSLRYYRNSTLEDWSGAVLDGDAHRAAGIAHALPAQDTIWLTRELSVARGWARRVRVGEERCGLIASGGARRLAAEGLFVEMKPDIANWVLAPSGDIRSSNMLETVQNQFQIQGLEIDYTVVCWDLDLRWGASRWESFKMSGSSWNRDKNLAVVKNSYRVLLTRARKGMTLFIPRGDLSGEDQTRPTEAYDAIADYLMASGAKLIPASLL